MFLIILNEETHSETQTFYIILRELSIEGNQIGSVVTIEDISEQERLDQFGGTLFQI